MYVLLYIVIDFNRRFSRFGHECIFYGFTCGRLVDTADGDIFGKGKSLLEYKMWWANQTKI